MIVCPRFRWTNLDTWKKQLTGFWGAAIGSEKAKKGSARLQKAFLNVSMGMACLLGPAAIILYISKHTRPATAAVVVAIAGMIRPAICLVCKHYIITAKQLTTILPLECGNIKILVCSIMTVWHSELNVSATLPLIWLDPGYSIENESKITYVHQIS